MFNILDFRSKELPTEAEIEHCWPEFDEPYLSIVCTTYNHAGYIEDAIRGFLLQKTDFPFEIIIHNDASTDNSLEIINAYAQEYPNIITVVSQNVNQYSLGVKMIPTAVSYSQGKFVALCEGDDFWVDPEKLQTQVRNMERYPSCEISFHPAIALYPDGKTDKVANHTEKLSIIQAEKIISADGAFCPTPTLIIKREIFDKLPRWFYDTAPVGDYYLQIFGSLKGGALFLPENMSVYRVLSAGSWSESLRNMNEVDRVTFFDRNIECLTALGHTIDEKFSKSILQSMSLKALSLSFFLLKKGSYLKLIKYVVISLTYSKGTLFKVAFKRTKKAIKSRLF